MPFVRIITLLALCGVIGCTPSGPALTPVTGVVTLDDKPFAGVRVRFIPHGKTDGQGGAGVTGEDGKYEIVVNRLNRKGLQPGEYKVTLTRLVGPDGNLLPPDAKKIETAATETVPAPYWNVRDTPFSVTVESSAKVFDISLRKK